MTGPEASLARRCAAEALGTAYLLAAVVGSGIMAVRLAQGNEGLALLANAIATGAVLVALILAFGPVSGAHFNPVVSLTNAYHGTLSWTDVPVYVAAQIAGAFGGVLAAHVMFGEPPFQVSAHARSGVGQFVGEFVATFGLLSVISGAKRQSAAVVAPAVGLYIAGAYWFTSSTSFANPAVTVARAVTGTFAGIRPADVPAFVAAQTLGALAAATLLPWLHRSPAPEDRQGSPFTDTPSPGPKTGRTPSRLL